jgi:hypothetical protein
MHPATISHLCYTRGVRAALPCLWTKRRKNGGYTGYIPATQLFTRTRTHTSLQPPTTRPRPRARCRRAELPTPRPARVHARVRVAPPCTNVASCSTTQLTPLTQKRLLPRAPSAHPAPYHVRARKARLSFEFSAAPPQSPSLLRPRCDRVLRPSHSHSSSFPLARATRRSARSPR